MDSLDPFAVFLVLLASYLLVLRAAASRQDPVTMQDYLFQGNRPLYAFSSGLGAMFSYSVAGTALLSAGFVFGWQISISLVLGAIVGLLMYFKLLSQPSIREALDKLRGEQHERGASFVSVLAAKAGRQIHYVVSPYLLLLYFLMLVVELAVIRVTLAHLLVLDLPETVLLIVAVIGVCYSYVFIGGYHGILLTDHFQLIVVLMFAFSLASDGGAWQFLSGLPGPTTAVIKWNVKHLIALHVSIFAGAFSISFASLDHWYRTVGTLSIRKSKQVLTWSAGVASIGAIPLVLLGSSAHKMSNLPAGTGAEVSLLLLKSLLYEQNSSMRVLFIMALTCIGLTTLDSYLMTVQQTYYEFTSRVYAHTHRGYIWQFLLKNTKVRLCGLVVMTASFAASFLVPPQSIYSLGVAVASGFIPLTPLLVSLAFGSKSSNNWKLLSCGFLGAVAFLPISYLSLVRVGGVQVGVHLYLIALAFCGSTIVGYPLGVWFARLALNAQGER